MKAKIFTRIGLVLIVFIVSCKTVEVTQPTETVSSEELKKNLAPWTNQIPGVKYGDPITFFNELEIKASAYKEEYLYRLIDGSGKFVDNSVIEDFFVSARTEGSFINAESVTVEQSGSIVYKIGFFEDSDTYFVFKQKTKGGFFYQEPIAGVFIDGVEYLINLKPEVVAKNRLLWDLTSEMNRQVNQHNATGRKVAGTVEIPIKVKK